MKRGISILLTICMILALIPNKAAAAETAAFSEPNVTALTVSYDGGETQDLLENQSTISLPAGSKPVFSVTFDNSEPLNRVFVTSTKNGETKYLEAKPQGGQYVTDDYFDPNDVNYIPGTISVTYSKKTVKVTERTQIGEINLTEMKRELEAQGASVNGEITTGMDGSINAQVVLDDYFSGVGETFIDASIKELTTFAGIDSDEVRQWIDVYDTLSSYALKSEDGKDYMLYFTDKDWTNANSYVMLVHDISGNRYIQMALKGNKLKEIAGQMSRANKFAGAYLDYVAIGEEMDSLREDIEADPVMTPSQKTEANEKISSLENDKKLFMMGVTFIPLFLGAAGVAAPLMLTALLAGYSSAADYFWDYRIGMIKGCEPPVSDFMVSGTCGEHLTWSLTGSGILTINGYGPMTEFPTINYVPWYQYSKSSINIVVINSGATSIGRAAFADCYKLENVSIPNTVETIGEYAFRYCSSLNKIIIPSSVLTIGSNVFQGCDALKSAGPIGGSYNIQYGWTETIPENAFRAVGHSITSVTIPNSIKVIGASAFSGCSELTNVILPASLINIGAHAFTGCTNLTNISIPSSSTEIGAYAFSGCTNLTNIVLSTNPKSIGENAFVLTGYYNNDSNWKQGALYIGDSLVNAKSSISGDYYIKTGTSYIADKAFDNGSNGFKDLTSIIMPSSITRIGRGAFNGCRNIYGLTGIYFRGDAPAVYDGGTADGSFYDHTKLFYVEGKDGWTVDTYSRWHGYPTSTWEDTSCQHIYTTVVTAPTCTERGYTTHTCDLCGEAYTDSHTPPLGHSYGAWNTIQSATPTATGLQERVCSRCGDRETRVIPATGESGGSAEGSGSHSSDRDSDPGPSYPVNEPKTENGSLSISPQNAVSGAIVTVTVKPDAGYELDTLTVTNKGGRQVRVTSKGNGQYTFRMPGSEAEIRATFKPIVSSAPAAAGTFSDVPTDHWAGTEISWALENGVMNGVGDGKFNPNGTVTRQQLWMTLARMAGEAPVDMAAAKIWAVNNSISDGSVPGNTITRQQMAVILYRFAKLMGHSVAGNGDLSPYSDSGEISSYAGEAMAWAVGSGILNGTADGTLNPNGTATRVQMAVILYRFYSRVIHV